VQSASAVRNGILIAKYYDPQIEEDMRKLEATHSLVSLSDLVVMVRSKILHPLRWGSTELQHSKELLKEQNSSIMRQTAVIQAILMFPGKCIMPVQF